MTPSSRICWIFLKLSLVFTLYFILTYESLRFTIKKFGKSNDLDNGVEIASSDLGRGKSFLRNEVVSSRVPLVTVICNGSRVSTIDKTSSKYLYSVQRQVEQFRVMIGTLLYFSKVPKWRVIVVTDFMETFNYLLESLKDWPPEQFERLQLERFSTFIPKDKAFFHLLQLYRPCNWQKIFLEQALPNEDAIVYVDSDILFTGPAEQLWKVLDHFNQSQFMALGPEPWYVKDDNRPYAGKVGLNMGVAVYNLTRMRITFPKESFGHFIMKEIPKSIKKPRHDQDVVNQFLSHRPHLFHELEYKWNFLPSDCTFYSPDCPQCSKDGITIVHGADATFYNQNEPKFLGLYTVMEKMTRDLKPDPRKLLLQLVGTIEGVSVFDVNALCGEYKNFIPFLTHHLNEMSNHSLSLFI